MNRENWPGRRRKLDGEEITDAGRLFALPVRQDKPEIGLVAGSSQQIVHDNVARYLATGHPCA